MSSCLSVIPSSHSPLHPVPRQALCFLSLVINLHFHLRKVYINGIIQQEPCLSGFLHSVKAGPCIHPGFCPSLHFKMPASLLRILTNNMEPEICANVKIPSSNISLHMILVIMERAQTVLSLRVMLQKSLPSL